MGGSKLDGRCTTNEVRRTMNDEQCGFRDGSTASVDDSAIVEGGV